MDARPLRAVFLAAILLVSMGASHRSANFIVETDDPQLAGQIAQAAEELRNDLAVAWLGKAMPNWSAPCVMNVRVGQGLGAGGATTFVFDRGEVFGWRMSIQGSRERIFDSVLPHEITHMIFASHFRRPLPRWADEGGATSVEHVSERNKHYRMLDQFLRSGRGIAFNDMFRMTEYPADVMPLYAQGFSLADYLIQQGGRRKYVQYLDDALREGQWAEATRRHYGAANLGQLQVAWNSWIRQGRPRLEAEPSPATAIASAQAPAETLASAKARVPVEAARRPRPEPNLIYRIPRPSHEQAQPKEEVALASIPPAAAETRVAPVELPQAEAQVAVDDGASGRVLPASGWHPLGTPAAAKSAGPMVPVAAGPVLARPQPVEPARQIILEWRQPPAGQ